MTALSFVKRNNIINFNILFELYLQVCDFGLSRMKHHTFLSSKSTAGTVRSNILYNFFLASQFVICSLFSTK